MRDNDHRYKGLGARLKALRERAHESLAEASGAVEIEIKQLASFELGQSRPTEDLLLLLLTHFNAKDDEAVKLWEMAGYSSSDSSQQQSISQPLQSEGQILFTDIVDVTVNNYGVVMNFMQGAGTKQPPASVSRVGMSREHAKSVLQILQLTLEQTEKNLKDQKTANPNSGSQPDTRP